MVAMIPIITIKESFSTKVPTEAFTVSHKWNSTKPQKKVKFYLRL